MTILLYLTLLFYGALQMLRLSAFEETVVMNSVRDSNFSPEEVVISSDTGLNFAFAITDYDDNRESVEDPRYGQVFAKMVTWGLGEG